MITLKTVFIRFYRSFNFDYIRRYQDLERRTCRPWEKDLKDRGEEVWYPYIEIPMDSLVTTVVGANESGKSHLLDAIEYGLSVDESGKADKLKRTYFCRYSKFFALKAGQVKLPYIGYEWYVDKNYSHFEEIAKTIGHDAKANDSYTFFMFRVSEDKFKVYLDESGQNIKDIEGTNCKNLVDLLPQPLRINSATKIPDSVPISKILECYLKAVSGSEERQDNEKLPDELAISQDEFKQYSNLFTKSPRQIRINLTSQLDELYQAAELYDATEQEQDRQKAQQQRLSDSVKKIYKELKNNDEFPEVNLIYKLLTEVVGLDIRALFDLAEYMISSEEGQIRASVGQINKYLASNLNLRKWWVQDKEFQLVVSAKDYDLGLAVRDRTGTEYSFSERSQGLRYFLSYFIQYKAQTYREDEARQYLLLMDEPDQYLSSQAQHSLLQIFEAFANPKEKDRDPMQVVYVTHSPFLVDRNLPSRVRLLYKGVDDEGTRLVDKGRNFHEPLRSAFGTLMSEDAFAGNCNIIVESKAEITMLTALSNWLHLNHEKYQVGFNNNLDLNQLTLISSEGHESLYDLLYISRGRSQTEKPAVIVLSNNKDQLVQNLERNKRKSLLENDLILEIKGIEQFKHLSLVEDLIPDSIWLKAANLYLEHFLVKDNIGEISLITIEDISSSEGSVLTRLKDQITQKFQFMPSKIGLAKSLLDYLQDSKGQESEEWSKLAQNCKILFSQLKCLIDRAIERQNHAKIFEKVSRITKQFLDDYEHIVIVFDDLYGLLEKIERSLDDNEGSDRFRQSIGKIKGDPKYSKSNNSDPNAAIDPKSDLMDLLQREFCQYDTHIDYSQENTDEPEVAKDNTSESTNGQSTQKKTAETKGI